MKPSSSGQAVPVVITDMENHNFILDATALSGILLQPEIADKKVAIISITGAFRKGKSFLLNFFLRFLQSQNDKMGLKGWLESTTDESELDGFKWRSGIERETTGILLWSEPFITMLPSGEKVALLLMDTQGAFDRQSTVKECATIFALSTMISSLQIYNLSQNIQEDNLQHLQLFTEYGRLALESSTAKPFQTLIFLVRDWSYPDDAPYGFDGGRKVLEKQLQISDNEHEELQQLRKHIKSCFSTIECFLMPHPGRKVATSRDFRGQLNDIESEFITELNELIPKCLPPNRVVLKEINGETVTCRELLEYFRSYMKIFQGKNLPEPKSVLLATAEANNLAALAVAIAHYNKKMEEVCLDDAPYLSPSQLTKHHDDFKNNALKLFSSSRKMGGDKFSQKYREKLEAEIMESLNKFFKRNEYKEKLQLAKKSGHLSIIFHVCVILFICFVLFSFFK